MNYVLLLPTNLVSALVMRVALDDLELRQLIVVYPGRDAYDLDKRGTVLPLEQIRARLLRRGGQGVVSARGR